MDTSVFSAATLLLFVMDPLGNIPLFLAILKDVKAVRRRRIIVRELLIALFILLLFLFFGDAILSFLGLESEAVTIAGGLVLLIIGVRMIFPRAEGVMGLQSQPEGEPFIVPLAVPLIAGPSAMATLILMVRQAPGRLGAWALALLLAWAVTAVLLLLAPTLYRVLQHRGLIAVERLMGMILVMIAVQMFLNGLGTAFG